MDHVIQQQVFIQSLYISRPTQIKPALFMDPIYRKIIGSPLVVQWLVGLHASTAGQGSNPCQRTKILMPHHTAEKKLHHTTQNLQLDTIEQLTVKPSPKTLLRITATLIISDVLYLGIQAKLYHFKINWSSLPLFKDSACPVKSGGHWYYVFNDRGEVTGKTSKYIQHALLSYCI